MDSEARSEIPRLQKSRQVTQTDMSKWFKDFTTYQKQYGERWVVYDDEAHPVFTGNWIMVGGISGPCIRPAQPNYILVVVAADAAAALRHSAERQNGDMAKENRKLIDNARRLQAQMGYINEQKMIKMIQSNQLNNCEVTEADIRNSISIYGRSIDYLKGNSDGRKSEAVTFETMPFQNNVQRKQMVSMDIMQVGKHLSLVTVATPLEMTFVKKLNGKSAQILGDAIINQIDQIERKGFLVEKIVWDSESSVRSEGLSERIRGRVRDLEILEPGRHVARVERRIQKIKKMFRAVKTGSVYEWDSNMDNFCVQYCVNRLNHIPIENSTSDVSPWTKMTGKRADVKYDYRHEFGEYVQYLENDTDNNTNTPRTQGALSLFPAGSDMWYYKRLIDGKVIKRSRAVGIPISEEIIKFINDRNKTNEVMEIPRFAVGNKLDVDEYNDDNGNEEELQVLQNAEMIQGNERNAEEHIKEIEEDMDIEIEIYNVTEQQLMTGANDPNNEEIESMNIKDINENEKIVNFVAINVRDTWRKLTAPNIMYNCTNMTVREAIKDQGEVALKEIVRELISIHIERKAFQPLLQEELTENQRNKAITSKMFIKNKYHPDGEFDKIKARLVAGGHLQSRSVYTRGGSPTASTSSVLTVMALAAMEGRAVGTIDFPSAFLNCPMPDDSEEVIMKLDYFMTMVLSEIDPEYSKYIAADGTSTVRLKKALYGCVESARIWNDKLNLALTKLGYTRNLYDKCVYNKANEDKSQSTIVVHVDDCVISDKNEDYVDKVMDEIEMEFGEVTKKRGKILNYVGMTFSFEEEKKVKVTMKGYIEDVLKFVEDRENFKGIAPDPARADLFEIDSENCEELLKEEKEFFHTLTAKLLYLGKRVRPDILVATAFLSKRVQSPTVYDMGKLIRVIQYIRGTMHLGIKLEVGSDLAVISYIDASYGVHQDYKSHTGFTVSIGKGPICSKSSIQKLNTKSSTEAELVAISDSIGHVIWLRNFLIDQGYNNIEPAMLGQDNMSTIQLVKNGQPNSDATRHIAVRFFFVTDKVKNGEVYIKWIGTNEMISDVLTKPIQGSKFKELRGLLLNWHDE